MYILHLCHLIDKENNIYDEKISKDKLEELVKKFSLINKGSTREYCINNVLIIKTKESETYEYITDTDIIYKNDSIIRNCQIDECIPFSFFNVDIQEDYILYSGLFHGIKVLLKEFIHYLTLEFMSPDLDLFNKYDLIE